MQNTTWNELEIASESVLMEASRQLAEALTETKQFQDYQQAYSEYQKDFQTQAAIRAFQQKQASLQAMMMLNAVSDEDRQELQMLKDKFYLQPAYMSLMKAQEELITLSQTIGDLLANSIGLDFGTSCRTGGCCG